MIVHRILKNTFRNRDIFAFFEPSHESIARLSCLTCLGISFALFADICLQLIKGIEFGSIFRKLIIQIRKLLFLNRIQGQVDLGFFAFMVTALKRAFKRRLLAGRQAV